MRRRRLPLPTPRVLAALAVVLAVLRHRRPLRARVCAAAAAASHTMRAASCLAALLSRLSADLLAFATAPPSPRPALLSPTDVHACPEVPLSLQRVMRVAASPDGLAVVRAAAAGLSAPLAHQAASPVASLDLGAVVTALASPAGRVVLSTLASSAVREAVAHRVDGAAPIVGPPDLAALVASEPARRLVVDVCERVATVAVPLVLRHPPSSPLSGAGGARVARSSMSAVVSNGGADGTQRVCRRVVDRMVGKARGVSFWERLAVLAIRDRVLVQDVVRVVVSQAVRTYLITRRELDAAAAGADASIEASGDGDSEGEGDVDADADARQREGRGREREREPNVARSSVWKVLARSVAGDVKRLLYRAGSSQGTSGWMVF